MARRILLFTGDGKGKTTAALGMALRAAGHGMRVAIMQFIKHDSSVGELAGFRALPTVTITQYGMGFIPEESSPARSSHVAAARAGLASAAEALAGGKYDVVVLDEICVAVSKGLLSEEEALGVIDGAAADTVVVLTGRGAPEAFVARADTVTEMRCIKHGFTEGITAQEGVEF